MAKIYGERWETIRTLKPGGQAETFVVRDLKAPLGDDREYVLKRLRNTERHARFAAEVDILRRLKSDAIVRIIDAQIEQAPVYLVMEYCKGGSIADHPDAWRGDVSAALTLVAGLADALAVVHDADVVHRDIKPANVLLREEGGRAVLADFGIAFIADGERHTLTDEAVGARKFTPPELADGRAAEVGPRSDVYSLGKLLYWLIAGGSVFDREQHRDPRYDLTKKPGTVLELEHINLLLDRMIATDPKARFVDARSAAEEIRLTADRIRRGARVLRPDVTQLCAFCKDGEYRSIAADNAVHVKNFGLIPVAGAQWRILACRKCGNIQLFRPDSVKGKQWWGQSVGDTLV